MDNIVVVALKKAAGGDIVGYFAAVEDVPPGWRLTVAPRADITDVMKANRCSKEQALTMMNSHWR